MIGVLCCVENSFLEDDAGSGCQIEDDSGFFKREVFLLGWFTVLGS